MSTNVIIDFDFSLSFAATTISNSLATGSTGLNNSGVIAVSNKIYEDVTVNILEVTTDVNSVTFTNCLFINCNNIVDTLDSLVPVGVVVKFVNCTFVDCEYIFNDQEVVNVDCEFDYCIIHNSVFVNSHNDLDITNSYYNLFVGYDTATLTESANTNKPVLFMDGEVDLKQYVLSSIQRDQSRNSSALMEQNVGWVKDAGCWTETRDTTPYDSFSGNLYSYAANVFTRTSGTSSHALTGYTYITIGERNYKILSFDATTVTIIDDYDEGVTGVTIASAFTSSSLTLDAVPLKYSKQRILPNYIGTENINGNYIQQWSFGEEKKGVKMPFGNNWISEDNIEDYISFIDDPKSYARFYTDSNDLTKWMEGTVYKTKTTNLKRIKNAAYDCNREATEKAGYIDITVNFIIKYQQGDIQE